VKSAEKRRGRPRIDFVNKRCDSFKLRLTIEERRKLSILSKEFSCGKSEIMRTALEEMWEKYENVRP